LSDDAVGAYVNLHFFNSFQKVGTFTIVNGQKQGGNVATYFCLADGTVLNAIAGPVTAKEFLQEARWVVETRKSAQTEMKGTAAKIGAHFARAHAERFVEENPNAGGNRGRFSPVRARVNLNAQPRNPYDLLPVQRPTELPVQAQVQWLLASRPSFKIADIYKIVYQDILGERVSNLPVLER
jgi:hypothetical protein